MFPLKYKSIKKATFLARPNRFIAQCLVDGAEETVHVKNTGRCKELLKYGATVYLEPADNPSRRTRFSLVAVQKGDYLINIDSQAPNAVVYDAIKNGQIKLDGLSELVELRREKTFGNSRFDIFARDKDGRECFAEVKGVTLLNGEGEERLFEALAPNVALFPDAPTDRGRKHALELIEAKKSGYYAQIIFLVQLSGASYFAPNIKTDLKLAEALRKARSLGVCIKAYETSVEPDSIEFLRELEVRL